MRIIDGDAFVLDTGLTVRLAGIEAPSPERRSRAGEPYAEQSTRLLEDLVLGRQVRLFYPGLTRDRYDRAIAYVETADARGPRLWLNEAMVREGGARVRIYPDTADLAEALLAAERLARAEARGLWAEPFFSIVPARSVGSADHGFKIIRASALRPVENLDTDRYHCALATSNSAFWIDVERTAASVCDTPPTTALVRGYVRDGRLSLTHALNIEPLSP